MPAKSISRSPVIRREKRRLFDLDEANRSLVYVSKIVDDICETYQTALDIQQRRDELVAEHAEPLMANYNNAVRQLNGYVEELAAAGVELKDYELGLVDFPAEHDGRTIAFCWKRGESEIRGWHEAEAGYTDRQPLDSLKPTTAENI